VLCLSACGASAQEVEPAFYKKDKKIKYSRDYTEYVDIDGFSIPNMRVPAEKVREVKSPAAVFLIEVQDLLEAAKSAYWLGKEVQKLDRIKYCIWQVEQLDPYWEHAFLKLEYDIYADYEKKRRARVEAERRRQDSLQAIYSRHKRDSAVRNIAEENRIAAEKERERERYLLTKRDSIERVERVRGYHFVNAESVGLRSAPDPNAPLIVNMRVCTYVRVLSEPTPLGYVYIEVSDYKGYVLKSYLVDRLDKISVRGADVKFARENHYVSIFIPSGSTYDPMRPNQGKVPQAKSPTDTTAFVYEPYKPKYVPKDPVPPVPTPTNTVVAEVKKTEEKPKDPPKKQTPTTGALKQCNATHADGSPCTNLTTTKTQKCYLHDN